MSKTVSGLRKASDIISIRGIDDEDIICVTVKRFGGVELLVSPECFLKLTEMYDSTVDSTVVDGSSVATMRVDDVVWCAVKHLKYAEVVWNHRGS